MAAPVPCHLLDEVEAPVQRGVHLPASGQPWKDTAQAVVSLPRPHLHKRGALGPSPTSAGFWRLQGVLLQKGALKTPPREHLSNPAAGVTGARASPRDAASPRASFEVSPQNPALLSQLLGGLQGVSGAFHHTSQERVGGTQGEPGPVPYRRRRSARSGRSNPCWGAPSSWTWSRRCERQSGGQ